MERRNKIGAVIAARSTFLLVVVLGAVGCNDKHTPTTNQTRLPISATAVECNIMYFGCSPRASRKISYEHAI
jgi:hypothetical protein